MMLNFIKKLFSKNPILFVVTVPTINSANSNNTVEDPSLKIKYILFR